MDSVDEELLIRLRANARTPIAELARGLGLSRTTVQSRLARLERSGVIAGYAVRLAEAYEADVDNTVDALTSILEPIMIVFVGVVVGFVAIALVSAMYGVLGGIKDDEGVLEPPAPVVQVVDLEGPGLV